LMGPGAGYLHASPYELAPVWISFFWCIVALNVVQVGWRLIHLMRGAWQRSRALEHITVKTIGLIATLVLFTASHREWVLLKHPAVDAARYGAQLNSINHAIYLGLLWVLAISAMVWLWQIGQMGVDSYRRRAMK